MTGFWDPRAPAGPPTFSRRLYWNKPPCRFFGGDRETLGKKRLLDMPPYLHGFVNHVSHGFALHVKAGVVNVQVASLRLGFALSCSMTGCITNFESPAAKGLRHLDTVFGREPGGGSMKSGLLSTPTPLRGMGLAKACPHWISHSPGLCGSALQQQARSPCCWTCASFMNT